MGFSFICGWGAIAAPMPRGTHSLANVSTDRWGPQSYGGHRLQEIVVATCHSPLRCRPLTTGDGPPPNLVARSETFLSKKSPHPHHAMCDGKNHWSVNDDKGTSVC